MTEPTSDDETRKRIENLRAILAGPTATGPAAAPRPTAAGGREPSSESNRRTVLLGALAAAAALVLGKLKLLGFLVGVLKLKTLASMVLTVALYATEWGLAFAVGFVLLIFVHECGHALVMHREGIPAGAPVFIPFLGAFIAMRGQPRNAYVEAKVALGGPVLGSLAAWAVLAAGVGLSSQVLTTIGHAGILVNLFNLVPVSPLDGGRIAGAFTRSFWIGGYVLGVLAVTLTRSPVLAVVLIVGVFTMWQRWRHPVPGYDDIPRRERLAVGLAYASLLVALAVTLPVGLVE